MLFDHAVTLADHLAGDAIPHWRPTRTFKFSVTIAIFLLGLAQPSSSLGQVYYTGIGTMICADFVPAMVHTDVQLNAWGWASGYISGLNVLSVLDRGTYYDVSAVKPLDALGSMIRFCVANPGEQVIAAADALLRELPLRQWSEPAP